MSINNEINRLNIKEDSAYKEYVKNNKNIQMNQTIYF